MGLSINFEHNLLITHGPSMELFAGIYPFFFLLSLLGLVGWFYFRGSNYTGLMSRMFLLCFLVYLFSLAFAPGSVGYKLIILSRDFLFMAFVVTAFQFLSRKKVLYFGAMVVFLSIFFSVLFDRWDRTFSQVPPHEKLSMEYEFIIGTTGNIDSGHLGFLSNRFGLNCRQINLPVSAMQKGSDIIVCNVPDNKRDQLDQISWWLRMNSSIKWWEWNQIVFLDPPEDLSLVVPRRENLPEQTVNDPAIDEMWHFHYLEYEALHRLLREHENLIAHQSLIAILDTGIDHEHEDISGNYTSMDSPSDGDPMGHGTHCAGIASAVSNNNVGIASQSPDNNHYRISSIRVLNERGFGTKKEIIKGIFKAADSGADVISLSLGGPSLRNTDQAYEKAVQYAIEKGSIVVVAAGNAGRPARNFSPANVKGVICVGAVKQSGELSSFSNTSQGIRQFIVAPGEEIISTLPGDRYAVFSGTSMATPIVASTAAIAKSLHPDITSEEFYKLLYDTGRTIQTPVGEVKLILPYRAISVLIGQL